MCEATESVEVPKLACPLAFSAVGPASAVPEQLAPSKNVTLPAVTAAPPFCAVTVAVKVTDCPNVDGLTDEETAVFVPPTVSGAVPLLS